MDGKLSQALHDLASKTHLLTDEAVKAKQMFESAERDVDFHQQNTTKSGVKIPKKTAKTLDEFNDNVVLLTGLFRALRVDRLVDLLSCPARLMMLRLVSGVFWGMGFFMGILFLILAIMLVWPTFLTALIAP